MCCLKPGHRRGNEHSMDFDSPGCRLANGSRPFLHRRREAPKSQSRLHIHTCHVKHRLEAEPKTSHFEGLLFLDGLLQLAYPFPVLLFKLSVIVGIQCWTLKQKLLTFMAHIGKQGKSERVDSYDRPSNLAPGFKSSIFQPV